ncbi:Zn-dependent hydrolase [Siminovitchia acidinfaciens]|uniref:Zn-dependent hydrolase n=1 Tax=Siminovitchia acidinfaciens TaxID=2321395 RepID=A0A429XZA1_9BACI|nr:Zn-dependent hydrolase [Siminovitchia acidinfaciens]RST74125.1 Zn-dependent hydrolase [Siminovitchia acidinfaciens]
MNHSLNKINLSRLKSTFEVSSNIGKTKGGGLTRLPLSKEDKEMRDVFISWLKDAGLHVRIDDMGNIYGRRDGTNKNAGAVMIGSHLDTQPKGGRFDGILGVLSALEVIRTLNDNNIETERPIEIVNFTAEEGGRFGVPMVGSGVITDNLTKEFVFSLRDKNGITFGESLEEIGYIGEAKNRFINFNVDYYVEAHIEQSTVLEKNQNSIGIVKGIAGETRFEACVKGQSTHAAHSPSERRDALVAASEMVLAVDSLKEQFEGLSPAIGTFEVYPSLQTITASEVKFVYIIRHFNDDISNKAIELVKKQFREIAGRRNVEVNIEQYWKAESTEFVDEVTTLIEEGAKVHGYSYQNILSTAGHDATYVNGIVKSGMIFAPSVGGLSHCEEEFTSYEEIEKTANVLLYVVESLAKKEPGNTVLAAPDGSEVEFKPEEERN